MHADPLLPLLDFVHVGMNPTWAWRKQSLKINQLFRTVFSPGSYPVGFFQAGQSLLSWSPGLWFRYLLCVFLSESWSPVMVIAAKAASDLHIPDQSCIVCKREAHLLLLIPQQPMSGSGHQCCPATSWIVCALRCSPSIRYWGVWSPPWGAGPVNMRHHLLLIQAVCSGFPPHHHPYYSAL